MESKPPENAGHRSWAHLRFAIVGSLLAAPPEKVGDAIAELAARTWQHPTRPQRLYVVDKRTVRVIENGSVQTIVGSDVDQPPRHRSHFRLAWWRAHYTTPRATSSSLLRDGRDKPPAALRTTTLQHVTAALGVHAGTEAVGALTLDTARLIRSLRHRSSRLCAGPPSRAALFGARRPGTAHANVGRDEHSEGEQSVKLTLHCSAWFSTTMV